MKRSIVTSFLLLIFAVAASAQSTRLRATPHPVPTPSDWKIEITTSGGFTGVGSGGLILSSDGALTLTPGNGADAKRWGFRLTPEQLRTIDTAVRNTRPQMWIESYSLASAHCCDLIRTTLSLSARDGRDLYVTSWLTASQGLPQDLLNLIELLRGAEGVDARYRRLCVTP